MVCPQCGAHVGSDLSFCLQCGQPLVRTAPAARALEATVPIPARRRRPSRAFGVVLALLAVVALAGGAARAWVESVREPPLDDETIALVSTTFDPPVVYATAPAPPVEIATEPVVVPAAYVNEPVAAEPPPPPPKPKPVPPRSRARTTRPVVKPPVRLSPPPPAEPPTQTRRCPSFPPIVVVVRPPARPRPPACPPPDQPDPGQTPPPLPPEEEPPPEPEQSDRRPHGDRDWPRRHHKQRDHGHQADRPPRDQHDGPRRRSWRGQQRRLHLEPGEPPQRSPHRRTHEPDPPPAAEKRAPEPPAQAPPRTADRPQRRARPTKSFVRLPTYEPSSAGEVD